MKLVACLTLALLLLAPAAAAALRRVPAQYPSIQAAVDAAWPADIVEISEGTYYESVLVDHKSLLTIRPRKNDRVVIDAGSASFGIRVSDSSQVALLDLRVRNADHDAAIDVIDCPDLRIIGCRIRNCGDDGIRVASADRVVIRKCRIDKVQDSGIDLAADQGVVTKCRIRNVGKSGVQVQGRFNTISNNFIEEATDCAVLIFTLTGDCEDCLVIGNDCRSAGQRGIALATGVKRCTVMENSIRKTVLVGISTIDDVEDSLLSGNVINGTGSTGVTLQCDRTVLDGNKIRKTDGDGIWVTGGATGLAACGNSIRKTKGDGIQVSGLGGHTFVDNSASKNQGYSLLDWSPAGSNIYFGNSFETVGP